MKKLKFKNTGKYLEERSARYEARFTENSFIRVYKCAYSNQWKAEFLDRLGLQLDEINQDVFYYFETKKQVVRELEYALNNQTEFCKEVEDTSNRIADRHNKSLIRQGMKPRKDYKL